MVGYGGAVGRFKINGVLNSFLGRNNNPPLVNHLPPITKTEEETVTMHVLIDGIAHSKPNIDLVRNVVAVIPELIGMVKVGEPMVIKEKDEIIGMQIMGDSHVSLTAKGNNVWIDIFSCRQFDIKEKALPYLIKLFRFRDTYTVQTLGRGFEFIGEGANPALSSDEAVAPIENPIHRPKRGGK